MSMRGSAISMQGSATSMQGSATSMQGSAMSMQGSAISATLPVKHEHALSTSAVLADLFAVCRLLQLVYSCNGHNKCNMFAVWQCLDFCICSKSEPKCKHSRAQPPPPPHPSTPVLKAIACLSRLVHLCACVQVTAQLSGWRTSTGLLLREPATASVDYTPALAKYA